MHGTLHLNGELIESDLQASIADSRTEHRHSKAFAPLVVDETRVPDVKVTIVLVYVAVDAA
jgi:hypothetical protein